MPESPSPNEGAESMHTMKVAFQWPKSGEPAAAYANQFTVTRSGTEYLLEFGNVLPVGAANRDLEQVVRELEGQPVPVVARLILSHESARQLKALLGQHVR